MGSHGTIFKGKNTTSYVTFACWWVSRREMSKTLWTQDCRRAQVQIQVAERAVLDTHDARHTLVAHVGSCFHVRGHSPASCALMGSRRLTMIEPPISYMHSISSQTPHRPSLQAWGKSVGKFRGLDFHPLQTRSAINVLLAIHGQVSHHTMWTAQSNEDIGTPACRTRILIYIRNERFGRMQNQARSLNASLVSKTGPALRSEMAG